MDNMTNMTSRNSADCFSVMLRYWISSAPLKPAANIIALLIMSVKYLMPLDVWCIYVIAWSSLSLFALLNYSLPFSRKMIWRCHCIIQSLFFGVCLLEKLIILRDSIFIMSGVVLCIILAHMMTALVPLYDGVIYITGVPYIIFAFALRYMEYANIDSEIISGAGGMFTIGMITVVICVLAADTMIWKKCGKRFIRG